jgi:hypothetical protein
MSLNVDTSQVSGFQAQTCTVVFQPTYSSTCTAGPYGDIQLDWQNNDYSSSTTNHDVSLTNGNVSRTIKADSTYVSADGAGTFFGANVVDDASQIGTDKNRYVTVTVGP